MIYHAFIIVMLFLSACSPMPGAFGLIDGVERVHDLGEMEVVEHPGGLIETASACNRLHWSRGERIGVLLTAEFSS